MNLMHKLTLAGIVYDLCSASVAHLFANGALTLRGGTVIELRNYTALRPVPRLAGANNYCDCHGSLCP